MDQAQNLRNVIKVKNQSRKLDARVITVTSWKVKCCSKSCCADQ